MKRFFCFAVLATALLAACVGQPVYAPAGPIASPQVAYRIDENRFFEVIPLEGMACARARLYYTDKANGIHTNVVSWNFVTDGTFIIDAANDQYLVAPIIGSSSGCQTGDGSSDLCASRLYYSQDGGRTWHVNKPKLTLAGGAVHLIGDTVYYAGQRARLPALANGDSGWAEFYLNGRNTLPPTKKSPIDNRFHCTSNEKG